MRRQRGECIEDSEVGTGKCQLAGRDRAVTMGRDEEELGSGYGHRGATPPPCRPRGGRRGGAGWLWGLMGAPSSVGGGRSTDLGIVHLPHVGRSQRTRAWAWSDVEPKFGTVRHRTITRTPHEGRKTGRSAAREAATRSKRRAGLYRDLPRTAVGTGVRPVPHRLRPYHGRRYRGTAVVNTARTPAVGEQERPYHGRRRATTAVLRPDRPPVPGD